MTHDDFDDITRNLLQTAPMPHDESPGDPALSPPNPCPCAGELGERTDFLKSFIPPNPSALSIPPLLVDAATAARLCGVCRTTWLHLNDLGLIPAPLRLGRRILWRLAELVAWSNNGMPARHNWKWRATT